MNYLFFLLMIFASTVQASQLTITKADELIIPDTQDLIYLAKEIDSKAKSIEVVAYMSKTDPCINIIYEKVKKRYCDFIENGFNLDNGGAASHITSFNLRYNALFFTFLKNDVNQYCKLNLDTDLTQCSKNIDDVIPFYFGVIVNQK